MRTHRSVHAFAAAALLALAGCNATISGVVKVVDRGGEPVPDAKLEGIVVNMINTTAAIEGASYSLKTDSKGRFEADGKQIKPGVYKIEANEPGYLPASEEITFKDDSREIELRLRPMPGGGSRSYRNRQSDQDKIINPGEVNIQPPSM